MGGKGVLRRPVAGHALARGRGFAREIAPVGVYTSRGTSINNCGEHRVAYHLGREYDTAVGSAIGKGGARGDKTFSARYSLWKLAVSEIIHQIGEFHLRTFLRDGINLR